MEIKLIIPGKVVPKQSAKFTQIAGFIKAYQPSRVKDYANFIKLCFMDKYKDHNPNVFKGKMLEMYVTEFRIVPKSKNKTFKQRALAGEIRPITKPDTDNITKQVKDALNMIAYPDDAQIVKDVTEKFYSDIPRIEILIKEICDGSCKKEEKESQKEKTDTSDNT